MNEPRTKTYLMAALKNWGAFLEEKGIPPLATDAVTISYLSERRLAFTLRIYDLGANTEHFYEVSMKELKKI